MNTETRNLKLKTSWISQSIDANDYFNLTIDNTQGKIENNNESYTWYNVNLRQLMGDSYYNKYSRFAITLIQNQSTFLPTTYNTNESSANSDMYNNTMIEYYISGFNFDPAANQVLFQTSIDAMIPINASGAGYETTNVLQNYKKPTYYFSKSVGTDIINISINRIVLNTQQPRIVNSINDIMGQSIFMFEIVGIN